MSVIVLICFPLLGERERAPRCPNRYLRCALPQAIEELHLARPQAENSEPDSWFANRSSLARVEVLSDFEKGVGRRQRVLAGEAG